MPELFPISQIERSDKSVGQHVALNKDPVAVNDRRTGETPFQVRALRIRRIIVNHGAGAQDSPILLPAWVSIQIKAVQTFGAKEGDETLSVGSHRAIGMRCLWMTL